MYAVFLEKPAGVKMRDKVLIMDFPYLGPLERTGIDGWDGLEPFPCVEIIFAPTAGRSQRLSFKKCDAKHISGIRRGAAVAGLSGVPNTAAATERPMSEGLTTTVRCLFTIFTRAPDHASHTLLYHLDVELPIA